MLVPGVRVYDIAQAYGIASNRVSEWRTLAKEGKLALPETAAAPGPAFAPMVIEGLTECAQATGDGATLDIIRGKMGSGHHADNILKGFRSRSSLRG